MSPQPRFPWKASFSGFLLKELGLGRKFWGYIIDPLNKVLFKRARSRVQKGLFKGVSLIMLPRNQDSFPRPPEGSKK